MKIQTSLNKQRAAILHIKDIFSTAEICGLSNSEMNDRIFKIQSDLIKCPQHVKSYVSGFRDCLFDLGHYWADNLKPFFISAD